MRLYPTICPALLIPEAWLPTVPGERPQFNDEPIGPFCRQGTADSHDLSSVVYAIGFAICRAAPVTQIDGNASTPFCREVSALSNDATSIVDAISGSSNRNRATLPA